MTDSTSTREKNPATQVQQHALSSHPTETLVLNNAQWFIYSQEHKSHKKGKGGPAKRWGHSGVVKDNRLLIYGGNGRNPKNVRHWQCFYELDLVDWEWTKLEPNNRPPAIRDSHSALLFGNDVYIYGGSDGISGKNDEFYRYDLNTNSWERIDAEGEIPPGREGHTACILQGKYMVIYGGWGSNEDVLTDTYCYDLEKRTWQQVTKKSGPDPKPRESQASCAIKDYIYIFGGQGSNETINDFNYDVYLNDLFRFKIEAEGDKLYSVWEELKPLGPKPTKRSSASVCTYKDRYFFIVGGEGYSKEFDEEAPLGSNPKKQRDVLKKNQRTDDENILLFPKSDVWFYDTELNLWNKVKIKNANDFIPHFAHVCCDYEDFIIVFGGLSNDYNTPLNDICVLSLTGVDPTKYSKVQKKKKRETDDSLVSLKPETSTPTHTPSTIQTKSHAPLCSLCKNRLNSSYNAITSTHHTAKFFEPRIEELPKNKANNCLVTKSGPVVTGAFVYMLSQLIGWPFAALGLLIDNCMMVEANNLMIDFITKKGTKVIKEEPKPVINKDAMEEEKKNSTDENPNDAPKPEPTPAKEEEPQDKEVDDPISYLQLVDDGISWGPEDFIDLIADFDAVLEEELAMLQRHTLSQNTQAAGSETKKDDKMDEEKQLTFPIKKQYALNLKIGGFRLGNTVVIYSRNSTYTCLGFLSVQKMTNLHMPTCNSFLSVCWDTITKEYKTVNGEKTKHIILTAIKDFVSEAELEESMNKNSGTKVLILNLKKLPIAKKDQSRIAYEYELTSVKDKNGDLQDLHIRTLDPELKRKLFQEVNLQMLEFSMLTYLRLFFLEPPVLDKWDTKSNPLERRPFDIYFNNKKVNFINVKSRIEAKRDEDGEFFVDLVKPKMFDGLAGSNKDYRGI